MTILIEMFLFVYLLAMVVAAIVGVVSVLTVIIQPEWAKNLLLTSRFHRHKRL